MRIHRSWMALGTLVALWFAPSAHAVTSTIGAVAPGPQGTDCGGCPIFQVATDSASPSYFVPPLPATGNPWTLSSWSVQGEAMDGSARLQVWRRTSTTGEFQLIAATPDQGVPANAVPSFPVSIPVEPRDVIGIRSGSHIDPSYDTPFPNDVAMAVPGFPGPGVGETAGPVTSDWPGFVNPSSRVNVSATLTSPDPPATSKKKRCKKHKKKHKRSAESAKKKKCKKRKKR
jgi:hypothetical protein